MKSRFKNLHAHAPHNFWGVLRWQMGIGPRETPGVSSEELCQFRLQPVVPDLQSVHSPPAGTVQITWIGHGTFLLQLGGCNLLIDPVFSNRCVPVPLKRFRRLHPPGIPFEALPPVHAVLITHAHYDHLDLRTLKRLPRWMNYYVPQGLRSWFQSRGFPVTYELGWWDAIALAPNLRLDACPAQHFSSRFGLGWNRSLWCGWMVSLGTWRVFIAGDTGYCPVFREIPKRLGEVALAVLPIGAYRPRWLMRSMHLDPEDAVQTHLDLGAQVSLAGHWGTFQLTDDVPGEGPALLRKVMQRRGLPPESFRVLRIGETFSSTCPVAP